MFCNDLSLCQLCHFDNPLILLKLHVFKCPKCQTRHFSKLYNDKIWHCMIYLACIIMHFSLRLTINIDAACIILASDGLIINCWVFRSIKMAHTEMQVPLIHYILFQTTSDMKLDMKLELTINYSVSYLYVLSAGIMHQWALRVVSMIHDAIWVLYNSWCVPLLLCRCNSHSGTNTVLWITGICFSFCNAATHWRNWLWWHDDTISFEFKGDCWHCDCAWKTTFRDEACQKLHEREFEFINRSTVLWKENSNRFVH